MQKWTTDNNEFYIGVDGGGSKTHAILVDKNLNQIDEVYGNAANIATDFATAYCSITNAIDDLTSKHNLKKHNLKIGVGVAGYSAIGERKELIKNLNDKYEAVQVHSDCHIACLAAHQGKNGAIIICGTGIVGYIIQRGQTQQIGGWGFPQGDLGGAAYLGLEIARVLCKAIDGLFPWNYMLKELYTNLFQQDSYKYKMWLLSAKPADYAQITKFVFSQPIDSFSSRLLEQGVAEVAALVERVAQFRLPISIAGGLAPFYIPKLRESYPELEVCKTAPAIGAVLLCKDQAFK